MRDFKKDVREAQLVYRAAIESALYNLLKDAYPISKADNPRVEEAMIRLAQALTDE